MNETIPSTPVTVVVWLEVAVNWMDFLEGLRGAQDKLDYYKWSDFKAADFIPFLKSGMN